MGLLSSEFRSMDDLFVQQLQDIYDAETRLVPALHKMAEASTSPGLKQAFEEHQRQTEGHISRLEQVFRQCELEPKRETCQAMKGLIAEGDEMISAKGDEKVRDAAMIAAAQRVEHYEIASYGTLRTLAKHLGRQDCAQLLQQTLDEEGETDKKLTSLAEDEINPQARAA
ncbi:ferritin-like domain-containing protein [Phycisphaerales bacterium AB-hyl4]|uniref:Ferritin-like domain-containing protein n=1 Tax=Natronomicrosphaera hydrolytica TaxID=3242702 RepID=A0ABV4U0C1_9BACT